MIQLTLALTPGTRLGVYDVTAQNVVLNWLEELRQKLPAQ
jgi:hypothetical protein